jgi:hypothetical protein
MAKLRTATDQVLICRAFVFVICRRKTRNGRGTFQVPRGDANLIGTVLLLAMHRAERLL